MKLRQRESGNMCREGNVEFHEGKYEEKEVEKTVNK
jgi:hypothetical protein